MIIRSIALTTADDACSNKSIKIYLFPIMVLTSFPMDDNNKVKQKNSGLGLYSTMLFLEMPFIISIRPTLQISLPTNTVIQAKLPKIRKLIINSNSSNIVAIIIFLKSLSFNFKKNTDVINWHEMHKINPLQQAIH